MRIPTPFDDVQVITGRRVRLPVPLMYSRHHSPLAVVAYAIYDVMSGEKWGPAENGRDWTSARLGGSVSGLAKAIRSLSEQHTGADDLDPDVPVFLTSTQRGKGKTALRRTVGGIPPVEIPEWTLGDETYGPLVSHRLWRLYAILLYKRAPGWGTVALKRAEIAKLARVRSDSLPGMYRSLEAAGLLVTHSRSGKETVLLPVTVRLSEAARAELVERLAKVCGQRAADCGQPPANCGEAGDNETVSCGEAEEPHPSMGTAPHPSEGTAPHPSTGTAIKRDPIYKDPIYVDPVVGRAAPSERAHRPKTEQEVVEGSSPSAASAEESTGNPDWRTLDSLSRMAVVDAARRARTREIIEAARARKLSVVA